MKSGGYGRLLNQRRCVLWNIHNDDAKFGRTIVMKMTRCICVIVTGMLLLASAALAEDLPFSGFLGDKSVYDQLKPGPEGGVKLRWLKPGVDFKQYNKFMVDSVIFYLSDKADYKGIDPQEMKELADQFNKEIVAAFKDKYPIVAEPGPGVARIRLAITNIKPSKPGMSTVSSIGPVGLGLSLVKKGATGGWTGGGETGVEMIAIDTATNEVIALSVDQQSAAFENRFSKWGSAGDAFKFWSERIVKFLDNTKGAKQ